MWRKIILPSLAGLCSFSRSSGKGTVGVGVTPLRCLPGGLWGGLRSFPQCLAQQRFCSPGITLGKPVLKSGRGNGDLSATLGNGENLRPAASPWHLVVATASHAPSCPHTRTHPPRRPHTQAHARLHTPQTHTRCQNSHQPPAGGMSSLFGLVSLAPGLMSRQETLLCSFGIQTKGRHTVDRRLSSRFLLSIMFCWKPAALVRLSGICLCFCASRAEMSNRSRDHVVLKA